MSSYQEFFLNCPARIIQYELIEVSHRSFSQVYRVVRNKVGGLNAVVDGVEQFFEYYPLQITSQGTRSDLDYGLTVNLGDLGELIPAELDNVAAEGTWLYKPTMRYWTFRSDDLAEPLFGPVSLEIPSFPMTREGTQFIAQAPSLNSNRTGEMYLPTRFPMLDGFL